MGEETKMKNTIQGKWNQNFI